MRDLLAAIGSDTVRVALMTAVGVTERKGSYNRTNEGHDRKRRAERLVRASGQSYTIVRPGWFDYNEPDQHRLVLLQGDRRHAGDPSDGVVARQQIAEVLVGSLRSPAALRKTFELPAAKGAAPARLERCSRRSYRIVPALSMRFAISTTCRCKKSRSMSAANSQEFRGTRCKNGGRRCRRLTLPSMLQSKVPHHSATTGRHTEKEIIMTNVVVVIGAGSIGLAIARRVSAGKHVLLADLVQKNADAAA